MQESTAFIKRYHVGQLCYFFTAALIFVLTLFTILPPSTIYLAITLGIIPIIISAIKGLLAREMNTAFFVLIAAVISLIGGEQQAIMAILLIMMLAEYVEHMVEDRTERAITGLTHLMPSTVLIKDGTEEKTIPLAQATPGMHIIVKTGWAIPVDGVIISGCARINESFLTGESMLQEKSAPEMVFAGTFVEEGSVIVIAQKVGANTMYGYITGLLEQAGRRKARILVLAQHITRIFVPCLFCFIGIVWLWTRDLNLIVTLLVFGSPLELTVITPLAMLAAIVAAFRKGILVKGSLPLELFSRVNTIIFDKTGTLTMGEPKVIAIQPLDDAYTNHDIIRLAAMVEKRSGHVLAKAILQEAEKELIAVPDPDTYQSITGHGLAVTYQGDQYHLGSLGFITKTVYQDGSLPTIPACSQCPPLPHTSFFICRGKTLIGKLCVSDSIRPQAQAVIGQLQALNISTIMLLSGDNQEAAMAVANQLGITQARGHILPDQKLQIIRDLQKTSATVAMIGDGINDAPALKQADVGIAMGAMGMEPAIAAADIVLMTNDLNHVVFLRRLSLRVMRLIKQNLIVGLGMTHGLGIALALLHAITPVQAAFFHAFADIFILLNTARLIYFK